MGGIRAAIVGATGYTGAELARLLVGHPRARVCAVFGSGRSGARVFSEEFPAFRGVLDVAVTPYEADRVSVAAPDVVFLATPHEASAVIAGELVCRGMRVIDLSAAFRLKDASRYPAFYGFQHPDPEMLAAAVYGLPELGLKGLGREGLASARLVAAPGCYPTSAIVPLAPLVRAGAVRGGTRPVIDSVSGVSGAGRGAKVDNLFCEVSLRAYGVFTHRHLPEIEGYVGTGVVFTPHVAPFERGIVSTIHVELAEGWDGARVREALDGAYGGEPFVRLLPGGAWPSVGGVRGTNFVDIGLAEAGGHLVMSSAIDNLVKGASGQAVQCMNAAMGLDERLGLLPEGAWAGGDS